MVTLKIIIVVGLFILSGGGAFSNYVDEHFGSRTIGYAIKGFTLLITTIGGIYLMNDIYHDFVTKVVDEVSVDNPTKENQPNATAKPLLIKPASMPMNHSPEAQFTDDADF